MAITYFYLIGQNLKLLSIPTRMEPEPIELRGQLLHVLPHNIWQTFTTTDTYKNNLQAATSPSMFEYDPILLSSSNMVKQHLGIQEEQTERIKIGTKENLTLHITRSQIQRQGANLYFIAVGKPRFRNPID